MSNRIKFEKCFVDPSLVKDRQFMPVVVHDKDRTISRKKDKDFPSTPQAFDLKDTKTKDFPSTPYTGEAYGNAFHNPRAGDGNSPDPQLKGSDYASIQPAVEGDRNATGRGGSADPLLVSRQKIEPGMDVEGTHAKPARKIKGKAKGVKDHRSPKSIRQVALTNTNIGGQTSDFSRSIKIAGRNLIIKTNEQPNDFEYLYERNPERNPEPVDMDEERLKRRSWFRQQKIKDAKENKYPDVIGRSFVQADFKKGIIKLYTQNQPLDPSMKPTVDVDEDDKQSLKIVTFTNKHVGKSEDFKPKQGQMWQWIDPKKRKPVEKLNPSMRRIKFLKEGRAIGYEDEFKENTAAKSEMSETTVVPKRKKTISPAGKLAQDIRELMAKRDKQAQKDAAEKSFVKERLNPLRGGVRTPKPEDEEVDNMAEKSFNDRPNSIKGGAGDRLRPKDVDENELQVGVNVEQEHVKNNDKMTPDEKFEISQDIALDHLSEDEKYYTRLTEMERKAKQEAKDKTKVKKFTKLSKNKIVTTRK